MAVTVLSVPVYDDAGTTKRIPVHFTDAVTLAQVTDFSDAFLAALDAAIGGAIGNPSVTFEIPVPAGLKASPLADQWNRRGALLQFNAANTNYSHSVYLPSLLGTLITAGEILTADGLFTAVRDLYLAGDGTISPTDKYENDLSGLNSAVLSFRK